MVGDLLADLPVALLVAPDLASSWRRVPLEACPYHGEGNRAVRSRVLFSSSYRQF